MKTCFANPPPVGHQADTSQKWGLVQFCKAPFQQWEYHQFQPRRLYVASCKLVELPPLWKQLVSTKLHLQPLSQSRGKDIAGPLDLQVYLFVLSQYDERRRIIQAEQGSWVLKGLVIEWMVIWGGLFADKLDYQSQVDHFVRWRLQVVLERSSNKFLVYSSEDNCLFV